MSCITFWNVPGWEMPAAPPEDPVGKGATIVAFAEFMRLWQLERPCVCRGNEALVQRHNRRDCIPIGSGGIGLLRASGRGSLFCERRCWQAIREIPLL